MRLAMTFLAVLVVAVVVATACAGPIWVCQQDGVWLISSHAPWYAYSPNGC